MIFGVKQDTGWRAENNNNAYRRSYQKLMVRTIVFDRPLTWAEASQEQAKMIEEYQQYVSLSKINDKEYYFTRSEIDTDKFNACVEQGRQLLQQPGVVVGKWVVEPSSNPRRGIFDYSKFIDFARHLTPEELECVCVFLEQDNCPGYTGVGGSLEDNFTYKFKTTFDSSD